KNLILSPSKDAGHECSGHSANGQPDCERVTLEEITAPPEQPRGSARGNAMTSAALGVAGKSSHREAVIAGAIGNVLDWYDLAVSSSFVPVISQLCIPDQNEYKSLLTTLAVFGVGFIMRPIGSVVFGVFGDRYGRRLALSAVIFLMAFSTLAVGLLPTFAQA